MNRIAPLLLLVALLLLHSCFTTRQQKAAPNIPIANPIKTALDTTTLTLPRYPDSVRSAKDTLLSDGVLSESYADSLLTGPDSVRMQEEHGMAHDSLMVEDIDTTDARYLDSLDLIALNVAQTGPDTLVIIGTGDIMPGTNYPNESYLPPGNNCTALFAPVKKILQSADVTFGNLEGVFCSEGGTPKKCNNPKFCYVFRMPDEYLDCILDAGYDVLSVANNHVNDFGLEGRIKTAELLEEKGVPFAGFQSRPSTVFEVEGVKYGFAAFAPHIGTLSLKDYSRAAEIVQGLDSIADVVIVSFHGGAEGRDYQNTPCTDEIYLGYNRGNVCRFSHTVVDAGADIVFGHGPHVTRAMELYKDRLICYSLGNFCTYARFNLSGPNGIAPIVEVQVDRQGRFLGGNIIPVYQSGEGGPRPDPTNRVIAKLQELNAMDFPDGRLMIDSDGRMWAKDQEK